MKRLLGLIALVLSLAGCAQTPPPAPDTRDADAKSIRDAEIAANNAMAAKDIDTAVKFWADDATLMIPNMPALKGNAAIRDGLKPFFQDPGFSLKFESTSIEVSKSSDIAYSRGTYTNTMTDPKTKKILTEKGNFVTVFKKQADGSWKAFQDMNAPEAPPALGK